MTSHEIDGRVHTGHYHTEVKTKKDLTLTCTVCQETETLPAQGKTFPGYIEWLRKHRKCRESARKAEGSK